MIAMDIQLYELPDYIFEHYKRNTKNNKNITKLEAQKKLTRNILLGELVHMNRYKNTRMYMYGRLKIRICTIDNKEVITAVWNNQRTASGWKLDKVKYSELNKHLGLEG